jgi:lysozyme
MNKLRTLLIRHEGLRTHPYEDSVGVLSVGVGRNLDSRGLSMEEVYFLLDNDIQISIEELSRTFEWFDLLNEPRRDALISMHFNMGLTSLLKFKKTLAFFSKSLWLEGAEEMLDSKWADQVGTRAIDLSTMIRTGKYLKASRSPAS